MPKYVCSWSGGKDSTAQVILAHIYGLPLDVICFTEVMFDIENDISGENPLHMRWIREIAAPLFESWGYEVKILRSDSDYLHLFNHIIKRAKDESHIGKSYGFPIAGLCSVKRDLKCKPMDRYYKSIGDEIIKYVGIAADEPKRLKSLHKDPTKVSLLEEYDYTEQMSRELCEKYGLLSPGYEFSNRGGCFFCPHAKLKEMALIKQDYREVWEQFVALEERTDIAFSKWNVYSKLNLHEIDELI